MANIKKSEKSIQRLLTIIIIILINIISIYVFKKYDLTKNKSYTLSKETIELVRSLTEPIRIKLFFSPDLPAELLNIKNYTKDLLSEYQSNSKGKISFEFVSTSNVEKFKQDALNSKIPSITVQVMEKDKMEYRDVFLGMALSYRGYLETVPVITSNDGLEYILSTTLSRLLRPEKKKIAYFTPIQENIRGEDGRVPLDQDFQAAISLLSYNYLVDRTDLFFPLPQETDMLIISGIRDSLHEAQLYLLDQFIMTGKPVLWFQDRYNADNNEEYAEIIQSNVISYLFDQYVYIKPNLILDAFCYQLTAARNQGGHLVPVSFDYPFIPILKNHNKNHIITQNLGLVQSMYVSELFFNEKSTLSFTPLLMSSIESDERMGKEIETDYTQFKEINIASSYNKGPFVISAIYKGPMRSFYQNKGLRHDDYKESTENACILMESSSSFVRNDVLSGVQGNREFLLNSV
ncbi:MAG: GldG family protein, partial [Candidatus Cloacimonetes bacterium]|nr:GldG family protein [Candidatus Cloacimonadota bacterium]